MIYARSFCLFLALILILDSCAEKKTYFEVTEQKITEAVYASGVVKAKDQYEVYAISQGIIQAVNVQAGDFVTKGQSLFKLQDVGPKLSSENAKLLADYTAWKSKDDQLDDLKANIEVARKKLQNDSLLFERQKELWAQGIGSKVDFEQRTLQLESSKANLKTLTVRLRDSQKELNFLKQQSSRQWKMSAQNLNDFTIKSKISGRVYDIKATPGEMAIMGRPLALIGSADQFLLEFQVDEKDITKIKLKQRVKVRMDAYDNQIFDAEISHIHPLMDEKSRSFSLEATFINPPQNLYPFLTAEANIIIAEKERTLVIPRSYLISDTLVMTENEKEVKVKTGLKDYQMAEIISGLKKGDKILKKE
jgi:multidrug efflux pump subunit AcrA (membrane-fusion protein)